MHTRMLFLSLRFVMQIMGHTVFKTEQMEERDAVADYLQQVVDRLRSGEQLTLHDGENDVTLDVPDRVEFEVQVEEESSGEMSLEFELEWNGAHEDTTDTLEIS